jgi:prophage antirepressor-like protein
MNNFSFDDAQAVVPFDFDGTPVRVVMVEGEPWFVLADVCRVLEHSNSRMAAQGLDDDEKGVSIVYTPGGPQEMTIISESGLYALIMTSRKPQARAFRRWVTGEVLPSLRRSGRYHMDGVGNDRAQERAAPQARAAQPVQGARVVVRELGKGDGLTKGEVNAYTGYLKMMASIFGEPVAAQVYRATPLARLAAVEVVGGPLEAQHGAEALPVELDGVACLRHLCACQVTPRRPETVGALMVQARKVARVREQLGAVGVFVDPTNWRDFVAVACSHPQLQYLFSLTDWAPDWSEALLTLDGARRSHGPVLFPDRNRRAVLVPWAWIEGVSNGLS